ncbi:hypothetical protein SAMN05192562_106230 [Kosakonia arachidis]|uniref:Uncharacterized protein n=1 Tax=Kosakonia arachidis TaxID=551989 RepID=A0A1I7DT38_9ENTR|nr:hypothetical protein SAMN05192562_106230 [Kosakonia arachidis]
MNPHGCFGYILLVDNIGLHIHSDDILSPEPCQRWHGSGDKMSPTEYED